MSGVDCMECGQFKSTNDDPRTPPLEFDKCLCAMCYEAALIDMREDCENDLDDIDERLAEVRPTPAESIEKITEYKTVLAACACDCIETGESCLDNYQYGNDGNGTERVAEVCPQKRAALVLRGGS